MFSLQIRPMPRKSIICPTWNASTLAYNKWDTNMMYVVNVVA